MSDLISRSEAMKNYCNALCHKLQKGEYCNDCIVKAWLNNQPTAYDIDKVVEELEKESFTTTDTVCGGIFKAIRTISAIEIVKQGGVSDDFCEWKRDDMCDTVYKVCGGCFTSEYQKDFKYCPYCGKKINVVEQMDEDELRYCNHDDTDEYHDCLDYMECEECPYYYADLDQESD